MKTQIIYEDKDLLVVKKPAGLATKALQTPILSIFSDKILARAG